LRISIIFNSFREPIFCSVARRSISVTFAIYAILDMWS
jgi:hypothetical protein